MSALAVREVPADLATSINRLHESAVAKARGAVEDARQAGEMLLAVKAQLPHGAFGTWLADNINFTERTAQRYMAVAENWEVIAAKTDTVSDLTLRGALQAIPKRPRPAPHADDLVAAQAQLHREEDVARAVQIQLLACLLDAWDEADAETRARFLETPHVHDGWMEYVRAAAKGWR